jgi:hypothetical protein
MGGVLWGYKTVALFDAWSIEHILSGISIGTAVTINNKKHFKNIFKEFTNLIHHNNKSVIHFDIIGVLFLAYFWESIEHYLELGLAGTTIEYWFQGVEMWANRLITDPLMLVIGYYIAKQFPWLIWYARFLSIIWIFIHIFIFPHSMYLHTIF